MNQGFAEWEIWLLDVSLVSTILLAIGAACQAQFRQPARRMAVARSVVAGLTILLVLVAAPGWPRLGSFGWPWPELTRIGSSADSPATIESFAAEPINRAMSEPMQLPTAAAPAVPRAATLSRPPAMRAFVRNAPSWRTILGTAFAVGAAMNLAWLALGAVQAVRLRRFGASRGTSDADTDGAAWPVIVNNRPAC